MAFFKSTTPAATSSLARAISQWLELAPWYVYHVHILTCSRLTGMPGFNVHGRAHVVCCPEVLSHVPQMGNTRGPCHRLPCIRPRIIIYQRDTAHNHTRYLVCSWWRPGMDTYTFQYRRVVGTSSRIRLRSGHGRSWVIRRNPSPHP